jgi:hypothetical protein
MIQMPPLYEVAEGLCVCPWNLRVWRQAPGWVHSWRNLNES